MCGIGGCVVERGDQPPAGRLRRLRTALSHRGPDGAGELIEGNVGLVATRLAIVEPTDLGAQPMRATDGTAALAYNGEVFNHRDLRSDLPDQAFRGGSDTETVL